MEAEFISTVEYTLNQIKVFELHTSRRTQEVIQLIERWTTTQDRTLLQKATCIWHKGNSHIDMAVSALLNAICVIIETMNVVVWYDLYIVPVVDAIYAMRSEIAKSV